MPFGGRCVTSGDVALTPLRLCCCTSRVNSVAVPPPVPPPMSLSASLASDRTSGSMSIHCFHSAQAVSAESSVSAESYSRGVKYRGTSMQAQLAQSW